MSDKKLITSDNPLSEAQKENLAALLNVIIPPSDDGKLIGAGEVDLVRYLLTHVEEYMPSLHKILDHFDDDFSMLSGVDGLTIVEEFSSANAELFSSLLFNVYACYYQDDRVHKGIGMDEGPPFPRGNTIDSGDLSLLDPVLKRPSMYRKV